MKPIVYELIRKDWELNRVAVSAGVILGILAISITFFGGTVPAVIGIVCFYTVMGVLGSILPKNITEERKNQTMAFIMSLPVSAVDYSIAKMISTIGIFLLFWITLVGVAATMILTRQEIPDGLIPLMLVLSSLILLGFVLICSVSMVKETESWVTATVILVNLSYSLGWYLLIRIPEIGRDSFQAKIVWNPILVTTLGVEFTLIALLLGLTLFLQTRKRDFI
jgi:ABC-2 type transport system permease protein